MHCKPLIIDYIKYAFVVSLDMYGSFIAGLYTSIWRTENFHLAITFYKLLLIRFQNNWPLKQVFRAERLLEYLASEKFVLASESNLSLATGLASGKVSLEPW